MDNAVPLAMILPITFNVELHVAALFKMVFPDTYKAVDGVVVPIDWPDSEMYTELLEA